MTLPRVPRLIKILAAAYLGYLALVLLIATPLVNIFAPKFYREQTGAELKLEKTIWINPFTLSTTVRQASSANNDATPFWSFDELYANVSLASVWRRHLVLDALALRGVNVHIDQAENARFNFSDILDFRAQHFPAPATKTEQPANADQISEPVAIDIGSLELTAKNLSYRAPHATEPLNATLTDVSFTLSDFSTAAEKSKNSAPPNNASEKNSATPTLRSNKLVFAIKSIGVDFLREQYPFSTTLHDINIAIPALSSTTNSNYEFSLRDSNNGSVQIQGSTTLAQSATTGSVQLHNISVLPAWQYLAHKLAFDMKDAHLDGDIHYAASWSNDSTQQTNHSASEGSRVIYKLDNSQLALSNVQLQARADSASHLGFAKLQLSNIHVDSTQPRAQIGKVTLDQLDVAGWNKNTQVSLVDMFAFASNDEPSNTPPWQIQIDDIAIPNGDVHWHASQIDHLPLALSPLAIHISNLHWPDAAPMQLDAKTTLNNTAQIAVNGALTPSTQSGELLAEVNNVPLTWIDVFVRQQMRATLTSGVFNTRAAIKLDNAQPIAIQSDGSIDRFELDTLTAQKTTDNRKLASWQQIAWQQLAIDPAQQQIRIKQIVATQPWAHFRINADGTNNFQQLMMQSNSAENSATAPTKNKPGKKTSEPIPTNTAPADKTKTQNNPWQFAVDNIHVDRATIDFRDTSLTSAFRTNITDLSGDISGLNSNGKRPAKVGLKGTVDGYAPVALTGTVNPFATQLGLNITLDITNIDLAALTPYAGTYAGYQIDGGRLSVQLAYTVEDNRIKGTNHIVVNQMQLGKQVSGPKVMDLPLRLAIYLLTDSNGVMDLGVDVTGNVDDPDFSVGSIIWKAFRNLIVKTATSPFRALGRLIGSDSDDLDHVEFQAGSDQLAAGEHEKLQTINKALQHKSALKLSIIGHISPSHDLEALRDNTLSAQLITQSKITPSDIQQQSKNWQQAVASLFKKRFPDEKAERWQVMQMNDAMRDNIELQSSALPDLAAHRALAIKQMLVTDFGLAADRAFVKPTDLGADKNPGQNATLEIE